jgi:hypothetical protein
MSLQGRDRTFSRSKENDLVRMPHVTMDSFSGSAGLVERSGLSRSNPTYLPEKQGHLSNYKT